MRREEKNYEFRKKLMKVHKEDRRNFSRKLLDNELEITDDFVIDITQVAGEVVLTAAKDFQDYLLMSMGVSVSIKRCGKVEGCPVIRVKIADSKEQELLGTANGYMGYQICVKEDIVILAHDERGAAQAFYYLEDVMNLYRAPYIKKETVQRRPMYSPRMVHSGYAVDQYPDSYLSAVAHAGMDAILVFTKGANMTPAGYLDFNELICRAAGYGIDVYAYSKMKSERHPLDPDAEAFYDSTYGKLFETCPGLKGVVLVGESIAFPSHDTRTTGSIAMNEPGGIPTGRIHPGWWPCEDYPQWLELLKKVIRKHNKDADIVFWTYNWSRAPKEDRVRLIETLPTDVSLLVTFEMYETYKTDGVTERASDYTLSVAGPGQQFISEAEAAVRRGLRLYTMANTGGLTWDFGMIPYEPFPQQWQRRHDSLKECREKYGLCGLMESHHYGFWPSFISELAKWNFTLGDEENPEMLKEILASHYGKTHADVAEKALALWSEGIRYYNAIDPDQYGPFRIGPAYPLCFDREIVPPSASYASFGTRILWAKYNAFHNSKHSDRMSVPSIRVHHEIRSLEKMEKCMIQGINLLEVLGERNDELDELLDLGRYIKCCIRTAIHCKQFGVEKVKLNIAEKTDEIACQIEKLEEIAHKEIANAKEAIPLVKANSRLGWEPSMEYLGDEEHIRWKIRQVEYVLELELGKLKKGLQLNLEEE